MTILEMKILEIDKRLALEGYFNEIQAGLSEQEAKENALNNYEIVIFRDSTGAIQARSVIGEYL